MFVPVRQPIRIPDRIAAPLEAFASLSGDDHERIVAALRDARPAASARALARSIASRVPGVSSETIDVLVRALVELASVQIATERDPDSDTARFMTDVITSLRLPSERSESFISALSTLMQAPSIRLTSKSVDLRYEDQALFQNVRIITDLRPVFRENATAGEPPIGSVIRQVMHITYWDGTDVREFFISLDDDDLRKLHAAIEWAGVKARTLDVTTQRSSLQPFTDEDPDGTS